LANSPLDFRGTFGRSRSNSGPEREAEVEPDGVRVMESVPLTGRLADIVGSEMERDVEMELVEVGKEMVRECVGFNVLLKDRRSDTLSLILEEKVNESES
jgi:hypothetical protein